MNEVTEYLQARVDRPVEGHRNGQIMKPGSRLSLYGRTVDIVAVAFYLDDNHEALAKAPLGGWTANESDTSWGLIPGQKYEWVWVNECELAKTYCPARIEL